jgi:hypothetical protein
VRDRDVYRPFRKKGAHSVRPLDRADSSPFEILLKSEAQEVRGVSQSIEIEVIERGRTLIAIEIYERRALNRILDAESSCDSLDKRRFACA